MTLRSSKLPILILGKPSGELHQMAEGYMDYRRWEKGEVLWHEAPDASAALRLISENVRFRLVSAAPLLEIGENPSSARLRGFEKSKESELEVGAATLGYILKLLLQAVPDSSVILRPFENPQKKPGKSDGKEEKWMEGVTTYIKTPFKTAPQSPHQKLSFYFKRQFLSYSEFLAERKSR